MLACFCLWPATAYAAASPEQQKTHVPSKKAAKPGWDFQAPDKSAQHARWRESISATLQQTTFAPSAPAGRYLRHSAAMPGKRLPPAQLDDLDAMRPPERKQHTLNGKTPVHGEFTKQSIGWRSQNDPAAAVGALPPLKEERRAAAYADFRLAEDMELNLGPEYHLGASVLRPEQTGHTKDNVGAFGMSMKLKIDF